MMSNKRWMTASACAIGLAVISGCAANKSTQTHAQMQAQTQEQCDPSMQLPKGWTQADMEACMMAGTPGQEQASLMKLAGTWHAVERVWMGPGSQEMPTTGTWTMTPIMDGRYLQLDAAGEMPGMGPYKGLGILGFDNVSQKYVATYVDQMSTGIMYGTGKMGRDNKTLSINYTFTCPINKKPATFREVMRFDSDRTMHVEMFATDPKSGKEYMCMAADLTKTD